MVDINIPLNRDVKYGHATDDFTAINFLITPEGLSMRPPVFRIFDIPYGIESIIAGFYVDTQQHIYLAIIDATFVLHVYHIDLVAQTAEDKLQIPEVSITEKPKMCQFGNSTFWLIKQDLYQETDNVFTKIIYNTGTVKPEDVIDMEIMNSTMYLLSRNKSVVFYCINFLATDNQFKNWEFFSVETFVGRGIALAKINNNLCVFMQDGMEVWYGQPSAATATVPLIKRSELTLPYKLVNKRVLETNGIYLIGMFYTIDGKFIALRFSGQQLEALENAPLLNSFRPNKREVEFDDKLVSSIFSYNNISYYVLFFNLPNGDLANDDYPPYGFCLNLDLAIWTLTADNQYQMALNYHVNINDKLYGIFHGDGDSNLHICELSRTTNKADGEIFDAIIITDYLAKSIFTGQIFLEYHLENLLEKNIDQGENLLCDIYSASSRSFVEEGINERLTFIANEKETSRQIYSTTNIAVGGWTPDTKLKLHFHVNKNYHFNFLLRRLYGRR